MVAKHTSVRTGTRRASTLVSTLSIAALAILLQPRQSGAWEAATTHAGLTEQGALGSLLHNRLRQQLGFERGLYNNLIIPPADAPELFKALRTLNPTHGYVPDSRGRMLALGWLTAGSVIADIPAKHAANHFYDPVEKSGLTDATLRSSGDQLRHQVGTRLTRDAIIRSGVSAIDWLTHEQNPMNLSGFADQYGKAVSTATPAERERHMAGALVAAGSLLHLLQDMGSPSHVRNDLAAHLEVIGNERVDVGSRFERIAALTYGRLSVPAADEVVRAPTLRAYFTTDKHAGLADRTAQLWFSSHTLPATINVRPSAGVSAVGRQLKKSLAKPHPVPLPRLDLDAARTVQGSILTNADGVCVANYRMFEDDRAGSDLTWSIDDECMAQQVAVILPEVSSYSAGMINYLFRGVIDIEKRETGRVALAAGADFGAGTVQLFWDDGRGVRQPLGEPRTISKANTGQVVSTIPKPPKGTYGLAVLFKGVDSEGQPLVAAGYSRLRDKPGKNAKKPAAKQ